MFVLATQILVLELVAYRLVYFSELVYLAIFWLYTNYLLEH